MENLDTVDLVKLIRAQSTAKDPCTTLDKIYSTLPGVNRMIIKTAIGIAWRSGVIQRKLSRDGNVYYWLPENDDVMKKASGITPEARPVVLGAPPVVAALVKVPVVEVLKPAEDVKTEIIHAKANPKIEDDLIKSLLQKNPDLGTVNDLRARIYDDSTPTPPPTHKAVSTSPGVVKGVVGRRTTDLCSIEDFRAGLFSDGCLSVTSKGKKISFDAEQTRKLIALLGPFYVAAMQA